MLADSDKAPLHVLTVERDTFGEQHPWWQVRIFEDYLEVEPSSSGPEEPLARKHSNLLTVIPLVEATEYVELHRGFLGRWVQIRILVNGKLKPLRFKLGEAGLAIMTRWMLPHYPKLLEKARKAKETLLVAGLILAVFSLPWRHGFPLQWNRVAVYALVPGVILLTFWMIASLLRAPLSLVAVTTAWAAVVGWGLYYSLPNQPALALIHGLLGIFGALALDEYRVLIAMRRLTNQRGGGDTIATKS